MTHALIGHDVIWMLPNAGEGGILMCVQPPVPFAGLYSGAEAALPGLALPSG